MKRLVGILLISISAHAPAADLDTESISELCKGQAVGTVAELRSRYFQDMTAREMKIARQTAVLTCTNLYSEDIQAEAPVPVQAPVPVAASSKTRAVVQQPAADEKSSWLERFLEKDESKAKDGKLPAIRRHQQTGGK